MPTKTSVVYLSNADRQIMTVNKDFDIYHVGVSGGKDSTALLLWAIHESGYPINKIRATFCDTGNEHEYTYAYLRMLSEKVHPIETIKPPLDFYDLAKKRHRFPSTKARFCTQELKIFPSQTHILQWQQQGLSVLLMSGIRADESNKRGHMKELEWDEYYFADMYRPLLYWKLDDVWAFLKKYHIPRNPLYDLGARRVGCFPCIMSNKAEIRVIAKRFPDRIDMIRQAEIETGKYSTFFPRNKIPERFRTREITTKAGELMRVATIDDVVEWSKTDAYRPDQYELDFTDYAVCPSNLGMCE